MLLVEVDGKKVPTRIGAKRVEVTKARHDGTTYVAHRSVRIATKTGEEI
jgi:large subunit ribosomal protein L24